MAGNGRQHLPPTCPPLARHLPATCLPLARHLPATCPPFARLCPPPRPSCLPLCDFHNMFQNVACQCVFFMFDVERLSTNQKKTQRTQLKRKSAAQHRCHPACLVSLWGLIRVLLKWQATSQKRQAETMLSFFEWLKRRQVSLNHAD